MMAAMSTSAGSWAWPEAERKGGLLEDREWIGLRERARSIICSSDDPGRCLRRMKERVGDMFQRNLEERRVNRWGEWQDLEMGKRDLGEIKSKEEFQEG